MKKEMNKRGLSDVVTTVLIILFAIVAVAVVGGIVMNQINKAGKNIDKASFCTSNTIAPISCSQNGASVIVGYQQKTNDKELTSVDSININVESATGELVNTSIDSGSFPGGNGNSKSYTATGVVGVAKKISLTTTYTGKGGVKATCQTGPVTCGAKMPLDYVGYWSFDELATGAAMGANAPFKDYSGNAFNGYATPTTAVNPTPLSDAKVKAPNVYVSYVAATLNLTIPDNAALQFAGGTPGTPFSISLWVRPEFSAGTSVWRLVITKELNNPPTYRNYGVYFNNDGQFNIFGGASAACSGTTWYNTGNHFLNRDTWYHYILVYDGSRFLQYVNGTLQGTVAASALCTDTGTIRIGGLNFIGGIDEVGIYKRALSADEAAQIYNAQRSKFA
jgi:hypothetical protein